MEETAKIYGTIAEVMRKINAISKGRKNAQQGFNFRGIDDVMNELHPVMAECGLFVVPTVLEENRTQGTTRGGGSMFYTRLKIKFTFYAQDGSNIDSIVIGEAMDTGDKASNKALSVGLKYAMLQVFCIPTEDEKDPDAESHNFQEMSPAAKREQQKAKQQNNAAPVGPAGGPDTAEEKKEINALLAAKKQDGSDIFGQKDFKRVGVMRQSMTAQEVIQELKEEIATARAKHVDIEEVPPAATAPAQPVLTESEQAGLDMIF